MAPEKLAAQIREPVTLAGDGVRVYNGLFSDLLGDSVEFLPWIVTPRAEYIGFLASASLTVGDFLDIDSAIPDYVRSSDAQLSLVSPLTSG